MQKDKVAKFKMLAGTALAESFEIRDEATRKLGAQLLLSETLEYVIKGLGVIPKINGVPVNKPDGLTYEIEGATPDKTEMLDGLCDVAYTMYWNALAFGIPLEEGFDLVCDNNLEKFVILENWNAGAGPLPEDKWHCGCEVTWPKEVTSVEVICVDDAYYAVGKDARGKVRKPSTYQSVDLQPLVSNG